MIGTILPQRPFDGQVFIDAFRIKWVYNAEDATWVKVGLVPNIPVARGVDDPLGMTNGLFSAADKTMLDATKSKAGGFGIVLKPGQYLTEEFGADNILSGNVRFISETFKFVCDDSSRINLNAEACKSGEFDLGQYISFELSPRFLSSYILEIRGQPGRRGQKGSQGPMGRMGTIPDGVVGDPGIDGEAGVVKPISSIIYNDIDTLSKTAVADIKLDSATSTLEIIKTVMDVPGSDKPATRVIAAPIVRGIEFTNINDWEYQLIAPIDDPASNTDVNMVVLPKGWTNESKDAVPVSWTKLSGLSAAIVEYYKTKAQSIVQGWNDQLKNWIIPLDKAAREALYGLAKELADCQFQLPLEFCLGLEELPCPPEMPTLTTINQTSGPLKVQVLDPYPPHWPGQSEENPWYVSQVGV